MTTRTLATVAVCCLVASGAPSRPVAAHPQDRDAIIAVAKDYFEGWFDGDVTRMERAVHPELAKRGLQPDGTINPTSAQEMIDGTKQGLGKARKPPDLQIEIRVEDVFENIATATLYSSVYVEYLHFVRTSQGWKLLNVLYVRKAS